MRLRLFLSFALVVLVSVATMVMVTRLSAVQEVGRFMYGGGMADVQEVAAALESYYQTNGSWQGVESVFAAGHGGFGRGNPNPGGMGQGMLQMMGQRLRVADAQGNLVYDSQAGGQPLGRLDRRTSQEAVELTDGRSTVGYLLAEGGVGFNRGDQGRLVSRLSNGALVAGLVAGGLSLLLALVLATTTLRPVQALTRAASLMAQGDLSQRVKVTGSDELSALGRAFNHMADSLQHAEDSRRAMTADIAHELRNPLAVQRANLEALQDGIYPLTTENLQPVLDQNQLLSRLVEDLRTLALADAGQLNLEMMPTDLPALAVQVVNRFTPQASAQQIDLHFSPTGGCPTVQLDPGRFEQILGNLLSNAIRHTPPGGKVDVLVRCQPGQARLSVRDNGPGIPEDALPMIFERFYRADRSRSREEGGTGLGLSIARQLAEAHGGALTAANHPDGGAVFTLTFPI